MEAQLLTRCDVRRMICVNDSNSEMIVMATEQQRSKDDERVVGTEYDGNVPARWTTAD